MSTGVDLSSFHAIFFEECNENIEILETELLRLDSASDLEVLNTIFRAAHSIKGGGATFGFPEISDFTHGMETILDVMRNGRLEVSPEVVKLLLASLDCLREMINCSRAGKAFNDEAIRALKLQHDEIVKQVQEVPAEAGEAVELQKPDDQEAPQTDVNYWEIKFYPHENLFFTGNDPLRLIRELEVIGEVEIDVDTDSLPAYEEMDPQNCYLGWNIRLKGEADERQLEEIFAWVEDDCELEILNVTPVEGDEPPVAGAVTGDKDSQAVPTLGRRKSDSLGNAVRDPKSIRVGVDKVDALVNLIGELVITQSILSRACQDLDPAQSEKIFSSLDQLERNTRDLQEQTMSIRMLPIDFAYQRLPRIVHDLSLSLGKKVELEFSGENIELDKTVLEKIGDPLVHLVRNALDHGIESPGERRQAGKSEVGHIYLDAYHQGGNIIVEISDDGAGLNYEKILKKARDRKLVDAAAELSSAQLGQLIFLPGLSTATTISDVSGRGVGMDVVKKNIEELGGAIEVSSDSGKGCRFKIRLPLTLAILDGQMIRVAGQVYIIPLQSIVESVQMRKQDLYQVAGESEVYHYRGSYIPVVQLKKELGLCAEGNAEDDSDARVEGESGLLVIIDVNGENVGFCVDDIIGQQQVVIKSLEKNYRHVHGLAGATVLGDGSVAMIIDVYDISKNHLGQATSNNMVSAGAAENSLPLH